MADLLPIPRRIAVITHKNIQGGAAEAESIAQFLTTQGAQKVKWGTFQEDDLVQQIEAGEFDLLIALGGDGTMLKAGNLGAPLGLPILGINLGRFGFLTEIQRGEWREMLPRMFQGKYRLEQRMMLCVEFLREGVSQGAWHVINEVVVCRGQIVLPIQIEVNVDGYLLTRYHADGLIASTPTGSTAYALAAGGPIMPPELRNILIIPVAPHLSVDRAIILSEGAGITITVQTSHEAVMSIDGHPPIPLIEGDEVKVSANEVNVQFVRFQDPGYFYRNITAYMEQSPLTGNRS
jgi:NAD+ kinase